MTAWCPVSVVDDQAPTIVRVWSEVVSNDLVVPPVLSAAGHDTWVLPILGLPVASWIRPVAAMRQVPPAPEVRIVSRARHVYQNELPRPPFSRNTVPRPMVPPRVLPSTARAKL